MRSGGENAFGVIRAMYARPQMSDAQATAHYDQFAGVYQEMCGEAPAADPDARARFEGMLGRFGTLQELQGRAVVPGQFATRFESFINVRGCPEGSRTDSRRTALVESYEKLADRVEPVREQASRIAIALRRRRFKIEQYWTLQQIVEIAARADDFSQETGKKALSSIEWGKEVPDPDLPSIRPALVTLMYALAETATSYPHLLADWQSTLDKARIEAETIEDLRDALRVKAGQMNSVLASLITLWIGGNEEELAVKLLETDGSVSGDFKDYVTALIHLAASQKLTAGLRSLFKSAALLAGELHWEYVSTFGSEPRNVLETEVEVGISIGGDGVTLVGLLDGLVRTLQHPESYWHNRDELIYKIERFVDGLCRVRGQLWFDKVELRAIGARYALEVMRRRLSGSRGPKGGTHSGGSKSGTGGMPAEGSGTLPPPATPTSESRGTMASSGSQQGAATEARIVGYRQSGEAPAGEAYSAAVSQAVMRAPQSGALMMTAPQMAPQMHQAAILGAGMVARPAVLVRPTAIVE